MGQFIVDCSNNKVNTKACHVCPIDQMLEGDIVAKASSPKPMPNLLYFEAQINRKNVSSLVDTRATHSFMSLKLAKELGLPLQRASKPIKVWFVKDKLYEMKEVTLHVTLESRTLAFVESFILCEMDEVDLILVDTFFKTQ